MTADRYQPGDYTLDPGTRIVVLLDAVNRDPRTYPDPDQFRPERFLNAKPAPYAWIPFGGGIKRCIGANFAMTELVTVLHTLLREGDLEAVSDRPESLPWHAAPVLVPRNGTRVTSVRPNRRSRPDRAGAEPRGRTSAHPQPPGGVPVKRRTLQLARPGTPSRTTRTPVVPNWAARPLTHRRRGPASTAAQPRHRGRRLDPDRAHRAVEEHGVVDHSLTVQPIGTSGEPQRRADQCGAGVVAHQRNPTAAS